MTARVYSVSEPEMQVDAGTGMTWVAVMLVVAGIALASALIGGKLRIRFSWADAGVIALVTLVGLSASKAIDRRPAINLAWEWGGLCFAYLLLRNLPRTRAETKAIAGVLAATAFAVAAYGIYQAGVEMPEYQRMYKANREASLAAMGIMPGTAAAALYDSRVLGSTDVYSTFALANSLAGFLVGPLVILAGAVWNVLTRRDPNNEGGSRLGPIALAIPFVLIMFACLLLTKSRSSWLGLGVAMVVIAFQQRKLVKARALAIAATVMILLVSALVMAGLSTRRLDKQVLTETGKSLGYRLQYWQGAWTIATSSSRTFWRGLGPGNFVEAYVKVKPPEAGEEIFDPHNMLLEVWTTAGFVALLALGLALTVGLGNLLRPTIEVEVEAPDPKLAKRRDPTAPPRSVLWLVVWGGLGGWLGVVLLGQLNPFMGDLFTRWLILGGAWVVAAAAGALLWRRPEAVSSALVGAALIALIVNLLAAGGIGIPVVAGGLWTMLAIGLNLQEGRSCAVHRVVGGRFGAFGLACVWVACLGIFVGAVSPYFQAESAIRNAEEALRATPPAIEKAEAAYQRAAAADQYTARPWMSQAALDYQVWDSRGAKSSDLRWKKILVNMIKAVEPPRPSNLWWRHRERARMASLLLKQLGGAISPIEVTILRGKVVEASRTAVLLYPTNASLRAWLAEASAEISMTADAMKEGKEALRLDKATPHRDKHLDPNIKRWLENKIPEWEKAARDAQPISPSAATPKP